MLGEIQSNNINNKQTQTFRSEVAYKPCFKANDLAYPPDSFVSSNNKKKNSLLEMALIAVTGASVAALALTRAKLGKVLEIVGEKAPLTILGRLKKVTEISSIDGLTGLFNRSALNATISKEYAEAIKHSKNYSVAMLDMDNFKLFNEVFDHKTGDKVLKRIATNIQQVAQKNGLKGFRYGGEEFVLPLLGQDVNSAKKIVEEIADAIRKDNEIQCLIPDFLKKAKVDVDFLTPKLTKMESIFQKLKGGNVGAKDYNKLADEIVSLMEEHILKYEPTGKKVLKDFIAKVKSTKNDNLSELLHINYKLSNGNTLGNELDNMYSQYSGIRNDLQKWINHVNTHKMFTVSGGVVGLKDSAAQITEGNHLVRIADAALKSAKENGKNIIIKADDDLIKKTIKRVNDKRHQ